MTIFDDWNSTTSLEEAVFQSIGAASGCWEDLAGAGIFNSDRAKQIGDELLEFIRMTVGIQKYEDVEGPVNPQEPYLGLATTEELFRELIARFSVNADRNVIGNLNMVNRALVLAEMLGSLSGPDREYRTVDSY